MMRGKIVVFILCFFLISSVSILAVDFGNLESYEDFSHKIPEFNEFLQKDPLLLPPLVLRVANNEDVAIHVQTDEGYIESFVISIYQNYITKIIAGPQPTKLYIEMDESTINDIIQQPEKAMTYYKDGTIQVKSTDTLKRAKLFVIKTLAKWFG